MSTPIWLNDPTILLKHNKLNEIWPKSIMTSEDKLNSITRLVLLLTILGYLLTLSSKIISIGVITLAIIIALYLVQNHRTLKLSKIQEAFGNNSPGNNLNQVHESYRDPLVYESKKENLNKPTPNNPLMNVLIPEIHYDPKRKAAAPSFNPVVEKEINSSVKKFISNQFNDKNIEKKLFSNLSDELMFDRSMTHWNTTANTQVPNDLDAFKKFVYGSMISGKEGNAQALERHSSGAYNYML